MTRSRGYILACILLAAGVGLGVAALEVYPTASGPMTEQIQQALDSLEAGKLALAERQGLTAATDPATPAPRAWAIVAAARERQGRKEPAARAYRLFLASCGCPATQQFVLGQIRSCQESDEPASAVPQAPSKRLTPEGLRKLADVDDRVYTESTEHFVVQARNAELAKLVAAESEASLDRICRVILAGQAYPHSVQVNVWPDHKEYLAHAADAPEWAGGAFSLTASEGVTIRQIDLTQRDDKGRFAVIMIDRVLPHEMCHLVTTEYFGDASSPLFLNEGLAMMAEYEVAPRRVELAGRAIAGKARTALEGLVLRRQYDVDEPAVFYAESYSFVEFLHERLTAEQFRALLEHVKAGCTISDALQRCLYLPMAESFIADLASAWEDHAVEQAQYLRALAAGDK